jgi:mono/diheme cytochrome c family protein
MAVVSKLHAPAHRRARLAAILAGGVVLVAGACSKGNENAGGESTSAAVPAGSTAAPAPSTSATPGSTSAAAPAGTTSAAANANPSSITPQMVALGDSIFHGQAAGGLCYTCHGADAKGTQLAPPLVQHKWLSGDGSYGFIIERVTTGMPNPSPPYPGPMLPMGGAQLTQQQIQAVSAYVYSLTHPNVGKGS